MFIGHGQGSGREPDERNNGNNKTQPRDTADTLKGNGCVPLELGGYRCGSYQICIRHKVHELLVFTVVLQSHN